jgi:hypothetical protein
MHLYFENSAEEFHLHETLSTPMKLFLTSPFINIVTHTSIFNIYKTLINTIETSLRYKKDKWIKVSPPRCR